MPICFLNWIVNYFECHLAVSRHGERPDWLEKVYARKEWEVCLKGRVSYKPGILTYFTYDFILFFSVESKIIS